MRKINNKAILLICLMCVFIVPNVKGIERIEKTHYCYRGIHYPIIKNLEIEKDEVITWDFTTYNSSFEVILALWINTYTFVVDLCFQQTNDKGEYRITQTGDYRITVGNFGQNNGYIHIVIENKKEISSYPISLVVFFSILGLIVYKRKKLIFNIK